MSETVSNAGPFIHLAQIDRLKILSIFTTIYVPSKVISEITIGDEPGIKEIPSRPNIKVIHISDDETRNFEKTIAKFALEKGEIHALYLCNKIKASLFLTDDLDARTAAIELGFQAHGSIGIITRAFHRKLITLKEAEQGIFDLYSKSNLFVTKGIVNNAIKTLHRLTNI